MQRYFASFLDSEHIKLSDDDVHHLLHVMRMRKNDELEAVIDQRLYLCRIESTNPLSIYLVHEMKSDVEINENITLLFALSKGDKNDLVLQKATELGAKRIALIQTERSVVKYEEKDLAKKQARYEKILKEASEQSHRLIVPEFLGIFNIKKLPEELFSDLNYVAYEKDASETSQMFNGLQKNKSITVLVGPEGGFSEEEISLLTSLGFIRTSLGKRILRAETAAIYALSVIGYLLEK